MSPTASALAFGLATALCFGTGDFLAQGLTRRHGWLPAALAVQLAAGLMLTLVAVAAAPIFDPPQLDPGAALAPSDWARLGVLGLVNTLGLVGLYRAFESGKLSLVSPLAGSAGAFSLTFAWLAGARPDPALMPGLVAVLVGIVAASVVREHEPSAPTRTRLALGVGWALVSALSFGWVFLDLGPSSAVFGPAWTVVGLRAVAVVVLLVLAAGLRHSLRRAFDQAATTDPSGPSRPSRPGRGRLLTVAALDSTGMLLLASGSQIVGGPVEVAIMAVLASCFPLVTLTLAQVLLRERLCWWQWLGVIAVIAGVGWIAAWSE